MKTGIITALLAMGLMFVGQGHAHKGHAGEMVYIMKSNQALKEMLPRGAKLFKRKESLDKESISHAMSRHGVDVDDDVKTYYLARDKSTNKVIAGAIIVSFSYRHGDVTIAVGVDSAMKVTQAALLSVNQKYLKDFESSVGKGVLKGFSGLAVEELARMAKEKAAGGRAVKAVYEEMAEAAVTLSMFMQAAGD